MGWRADGGLWLLVRGGGLFLSKGTGVSEIDDRSFVFLLSSEATLIENMKNGLEVQCGFILTLTKSHIPPSFTSYSSIEYCTISFHLRLGDA